MKMNPNRSAATSLANLTARDLHPTHQRFSAAVHARAFLVFVELQAKTMEDETTGYAEASTRRLFEEVTEVTLGRN